MAQYSYTNFNTISTVTYPEGSVSYTYDNAMQVMSVTNRLKNNTAISQYSYRYDKLGNQIQKTDNGQVTQYAYDALSRLQSVTEPDGRVTKYTFDKNQNITLKEVTHPAEDTYTFRQDGEECTLGSIAADSTTYAYDANNRLQQERRYIGGVGEDYSGLLEVVRQYTYDANGNTLTAETSGQADRSVVNYTYDNWNRMTAYAADGKQTAYAYNGAGQRTEKTTDGQTTRFYWDRGYIADEIGAENAINYIGAQGVFARKAGSETSYMMKNAHGDVTAQVSGGAVTRRYDYDAYGAEKAPAPADANPFRYCGEYYDAESGQIYLRARYYAPGVGRFLTEDPARAGLNWYVYCGNNPVMFVDPSGLDSWVFYDGDSFSEQAKTEAERLKVQYDTEVHLIDIWSLTGFLENWNRMVEADSSIDEVSMLFHGSPFTIYLGEADGRVGQLTSSTQDVTPHGSPGYYVGDLTTASMKSLNIMTCNGGHLDYIYSNDTYKKRAFNHNIAVEFLVTQDVDVVYGMDGSLSYSKQFGNYIPRLAWKQDDYYSWTPSRDFLGKRDPVGEIAFWLHNGEVVYWPIWTKY